MGKDFVPNKAAEQLVIQPVSCRCFHRRQGSSLANSALCGQERETGSVALKVGDWGVGGTWWMGVGRRWGLRPARQLAELGSRGDGYRRGPTVVFKYSSWYLVGGSGQAVGELSPCREVWSHSTAAAAHWPAARKFLSQQIPI